MVTSSVPIRNHGSLGPRRPGTEIENRPAIARNGIADRRSDAAPSPAPAASVSSTVMIKRPPAGTIPDAPGSYQFKDAAGRVIYVGKAASLRQRLSNYFADPRTLPVRTGRWSPSPSRSSGRPCATRSRR